MSTPRFFVAYSARGHWQLNLIATLSPVSELTARLTLPNAPSPRVSCTSYLPTFIGAQRIARLVQQLVEQLAEQLAHADVAHRAPACDLVHEVGRHRVGERRRLHELERDDAAVRAVARQVLDEKS